LTEPKNAIIKQYTKLLELDGITLSFDDEALGEIARLTIDRHTGARGLRSIVEELLHDAMFMGPDNEHKEIHITQDMVVEHFNIQERKAS
jgi:ATP-dependent Clp protease ATP-binding subunit ClpX